MDLATFKQSLQQATPPEGLTPALQALWWDGKGDWDKAHHCAVHESRKDAARIHAYLHRKEGDQSNAAYWYRRAGKPVERGSLDAEWTAIVTALLSDPASTDGR